MNDQPKTEAPSNDAPKNGADALIADAKGVASHIATDAKEAVGKLAGEAKSEIEKRLTSGKDGAAKTVGGVAEVLRHGVEDMDADSPLPRLADEAAQRIEQVAEYVQSRTIGDLVREVERFARRGIADRWPSSSRPKPRSPTKSARARSGRLPCSGL